MFTHNLAFREDAKNKFTYLGNIRGEIWLLVIKLTHYKSIKKCVTILVPTYVSNLSKHSSLKHKYFTHLSS